MILSGSNAKFKAHLREGMTVREFIDDIIMKDSEKYKKYYLIHTNVELDGKRNLILYFQDNILKSHHTTYDKFDYNDVLDCEIYNSYQEKIIQVTDIVSVSKDYNEDDRISKRKKTEKKDSKEVIEKTLKKIKRENEISESRNIQFKENVSYEELVGCVKVLVSDYYEQSYNNYELERRNERLDYEIEKLKEQIKWLEYHFENK